MATYGRAGKSRFTLPIYNRTGQTVTLLYTTGQRVIGTYIDTRTASVTYTSSGKMYVYARSTTKKCIQRQQCKSKFPIIFYLFTFFSRLLYNYLYTYTTTPNNHNFLPFLFLPLTHSTRKNGLYTSYI